MAELGGCRIHALPGSGSLRTMNAEPATSHQMPVSAAAQSFDSRARFPNAWFPGRVIAGIALILGPMLWLVGLTLRYAGLEAAVLTANERTWLAEQPFAAPGQLVAYARNPNLVIAGYATFAAACVVLVFGMIGFARVVAERSKLLAQLGGVAVVASLAGRLYFSGVELTSFRLVDVIGLAAATEFVMDSYVELSYGLAYVPVVASAGALVGGVLLSVAALRTGTLGILRCVLLLAWAWTFLGVLKESDVGSIQGGIALCVVMVPVGIELLRRRLTGLEEPSVPDDRRRELTEWLW